MRHVSIVGAALSANKGAAAMLETVVERLPSYVGECEFTILTTYPNADRPKAPTSSAVSVVGLTPIRLAIIEIPVACLAFVARKLRLPLLWVRTKAGREILRSDVVVDVAGISFVDGRGLPIVVYNTLMTGLPLLLGVPTVKAAQALGPFHTQPNKTLAKLVLPHLGAICARGKRTRQHLDELNLSNVTDVADLAFSLSEAADLPADVSHALNYTKNFVLVMPSAVVRGIYEGHGGNYVNAVTQLIRQLRTATGKSVVIAPHSYRVGMPEGRMNDGPVCVEIGALLKDDPGVVTLDADLSAGQLRHLVSMSDVLVTSRFHAMISGLATCTPTLVLGWSHKYREVLDDFGLVEYGMDSDALSQPEKIVTKVQSLINQHEEIVNQIALRLPMVQERSAKNFSVIAAAMG